MDKTAFMLGYLDKESVLNNRFHQIELEKAAQIKLDIEKGDILLGGRYKNKREVVEDIGTDELGQPTVNGKKLLSFRIEKKLPKHKWSKKSLDDRS